MCDYNVIQVEEITISSLQKYLEEGWRILHIGTCSDTDTYVHNGEPIYNSYIVYVVGKPFPQYCNGGRGNFDYLTPSHETREKEYNLQSDKWECSICKPLLIERGLAE